MIGVLKKTNASKIKPRIITTQCFAQCDHFAYCDIKNSPCDRVYAERDVNEAWQKMYNILLEATNKHTPII